MEIVDFALLVVFFFVIALLYSSVGFGGGSSYLSILTLVLVNFYTIRSTALICNLTVVTGSCILYFKSGHLSLKKFLPFIITSIPLAFIGAIFKLTQNVFFIILGFSLIISALALAFQTLNSNFKEEPKQYAPWVSYVLGGAIGFLSGLVGIGGGIFLAPILNHLKWDRPIVISALASFFIWVNSISGIGGLLVSNTLSLYWPHIIGLLIAVFLGGQLGVRISLGKLSAKAIRLITSILVFLVGIRVVCINGLQLNF